MGQSEVNLEDDEDFLGAVASNAGDDFHVIWAAREMLRLLDADGDVSAVKVEGPPRDEVHAHIGEHAQAADITLTRNTPDGHTYRYLQLKHSASNPQDAWNWSRLLTRRAKTKPLSSVLGKLAGLSAEDERVLQEFNEEITSALPIGSSEVHQIVQVAVGEYLAKRRAASSQRLRDLRRAVKDQILAALERL